jgi:hypothetical protein
LACQRKAPHYRSGRAFDILRRISKESAMSKFFVLVIGALLAGYALHAWSQQGRIDVRTAVTPMGTSSSNGVSFAWFYDSTERAVYVCSTTPGAAGGVDCKAKSHLP